MPKTFTADIGSATFPDKKFSYPTANTATADLAKNVGGIALKVDKQISEAKLTGDESATTLTVGGIDMPDAAKQQLPDADAVKLANEIEGDLSLRKIKRMRDQGIVSASAAKILASNAVQAASARRPGYAADYRQQAAAFFGDFGEGQGTLDVTAGEKEAAKKQAQQEAAAFAAGEYDPDPVTGQPIYTTAHFQRLQKIQFANTQAALAKHADEESIRQSKHTAATLDHLARGTAFTNTLGVVGKMNAELTKTGKIMKPELLDHELNMGEMAAHAELDGRIARASNGTVIISGDDAKRSHEAITNYFKRTKEAVQSQSWQTLLKNNKELATNFLALQGMAAMPAWAAGEAAFPGGGLFMAEQSNRLNEMNDAQRTAYLQLHPGEEYLWTHQKGLEEAGKTLRAIVAGVIPDWKTDPAAYSVNQQVAKDTISKPNGKDDPLVGKALDQQINAAMKGDPNSLFALGSYATRANTTPEQRAKIGISVANEYANLKISVPQVLASSVNYDLQWDGKYFIPTLTEKGKKFYAVELSQEEPGKHYAGLRPGMSHAPEEVKRAAKALNTIVRNLKTYAADPEFWPKDTKDPALDKFLGALRSNSPEAVGKHMLAELHNNKTRIEKAREAEAAPKPTQAQLNAEAEAIKAEDLASQGAQ